MAQSSFPWDGTTLGDATQAEYNSDEFAREWFQLVLVYDRTSEGVIDTGYAGLTGGLVVSAGSGVVNVGTGAAIVDGRLYKNTAQVTLTPDDTPSTRIDRVVLRRDVAAQTVRAVILKGTDGVGSPTALTQTAATWEISLAQFALTPGPTIGTVTQEARAIRSPLGPGYQATLLAADDLTHTATAWNDLGAGTTMSLGPGKWLMWGTAFIEAGTGYGVRSIRLWDNTGGSLMAVAALDLQAPGGTNIYHGTISTPPVVVDLSVVTQIRLQFYAIDANDVVYGGTASSASNDSRCTGMVAIRVI